MVQALRNLPSVLYHTYLPTNSTSSIKAQHLLANLCGLHNFQSFPHKALTQAKSDATKLSTIPESLQTILRLYSICNLQAHRPLRSCDVINTDFNALPPDIHLWNSKLTDEFSQMTEGLINNITSNQQLTFSTPSCTYHCQMLTNQGDLGLQHPRLNAITSFMLFAKRCLQYSQHGVWLGNNSPQPHLLCNITSI
jgi:hypothetical protein